MVADLHRGSSTMILDYYYSCLPRRAHVGMWASTRVFVLRRTLRAALTALGPGTHADTLAAHACMARYDYGAGDCL